MPVVSKAQNAAMHAAAEGKSTLGIPKSVGNDFVNASHGMSMSALPQKVGGSSNHHAKATHHAKAIVSALAKNDHKTAMQHIGHALMATKNAMKAAAPAPASAPSLVDDDSSPNDADDLTPSAPQMPSAPAKPTFNRSRFAGLKQRKP